MDSLVLHACCGPCASHCCVFLLKENKRPLLFYSNSNISPREEFEKRWENLKKLADALSLEAYRDDYGHEAWLAFVKGHEKDPEGGERCRLCFTYNLGRARAFALERGLDFTTSLTVSPHKNSKVIFEVGRSLGGFLEYDFKKQNGFLRSIELAKEFGLYRQNYCGCEFSLSQREKE